MLPRLALSAAAALLLALSTTQVLAAQPAGVVQGRITDSFGDPLPDAAVEAVSPSGYVSAVRTDGNGRYELPPLVAGTYRLTFSLDGYTGQSAEVLVTAGRTVRLAASLEPLVPARLAGTVVDQQGLALPGAIVEAASGEGTPAAATTDGAGRFAFGPLRPGPWRLAASMPGFVGTEVAVDLAFSEQADIRVPLALDYALTEEVVVVGSRRQVEQRTMLESPVPVDVLTAEDFASQPRTDMADLMRTLAPSFNALRQPVSDGAPIVRPVNLRNLSPDHLLVLVNGKRRHRSPIVAWLGSGLSQGSQGPDISAIPAIAVRQAELLRDGAAAQYGSDAIAGVVNFALKDAREGGSLILSTGSYLTPNTGDPATCAAPGSAHEHACDAIGGRAGIHSLAANAGLPLGSSGFANLSLEYGGAEPTNRAVQRADAAALEAAGNTAVRNPVQVWGLPRVDDDLKAFANFGGPAGAITPYGHAGYARRTVTSGFHYRHPHTYPGIFAARQLATTPIDPGHAPGPDQPPALLVGDRLFAASGGTRSAGCSPGVPVADGAPHAATLRLVETDPDCFTLYSRFPGGFTPQFGGTLTDSSAVAGIRSLRADGFGWDASASLGRARLDQRLTHSVNASLGPDSPTSFQPGGSGQTEAGLNFDMTVPAGAWHAGLGGEWRRETFEVLAGDEASWAEGPYAMQGFSAGSNGFIGHHPELAVGRSSRANAAAYADVEYLDPDDRFTFGGAFRSEYFPDFDETRPGFGLTMTGKGAGRIALPGWFSLRGAVSTGFRAPTPGQQHAFKVTLDFIRKHIFHGDRGGEILQALGDSVGEILDIFVHASKLRPERSRHYSLGLTRRLSRMQVAADLFRIDVSDRVALSRDIQLSLPQLQALAGLGLPQIRDFPMFRFFVNDFSTTTRGADLTWTWRATEHATVGASFNWTDTSIHSLTGTGIDDYRTHTLEHELPTHRWQAWARPSFGRWTFTGRYTWFGGYWDSEDARYAHLLGVFASPLGYPAYPGRGLLDVDATLAVSDGLDLSVGVENALSTVPADNPYAALTVGNRYGQFSPFGFDGAYLYGKLRYAWGR